MNLCSCFQNRNKQNYKNIKKLKKIADVEDYNVEQKLIDYECLICLEEFNKNEIVSLIKCGHIYHTHCLYSWFLVKKVCPLCDKVLII